MFRWSEMSVSVTLRMEGSPERRFRVSGWCIGTSRKSDKLGLVEIAGFFWFWG